MRTDVAILGAGPAGCATALQLLHSGLSVTLLESTAFPRARPGETLSPGIEPLLGAIGAADAVLAGTPLRHAGTQVAWGERCDFVPFGADARGQWLGFQVARSDLDARLLAAATRQGATVIGCKPLALTTRRGRVTGVKTALGDISAAWVVDATGRSRWVARQLGIAVHRRSPPLLARYGYASGVASAPVPPQIRADASGWTWTAHVAPQRVHWLRVTPPQDRPRADWIPPAFRGLRQETLRGADVTWRLTADTVGPGWLLAGDAAGQLDPSGGHGVLHAVMSGVMAAQAIARGSIRAYSDWFRELYEHDAAQMGLNYREARLFGYAP